MNDKKQIEEMAKEVARVLFEIRQDMTSVIRYIRHDVSKEKELYSDFTLGHFIDRHLKYRQLADETSRNILKNLNENSKLKEIENLCVNIARNGFPKDSVVLSREEYENNYVTVQMYELAKAFHNEKCAEFEKLCYDYEKLKQQLKEAQEFWKASYRTEQEARKETAEKIYSLYAKKVDQIILELKADFNTKTFNNDFEKTIKESLANTQIETLIITKNGVREFVEQLGVEIGE